MAPRVRLIADLSRDVANALLETARVQGILPQALANAIGTERTLTAARRRGAKVLLDQGGRLTELRFAA